MKVLLAFAVFQTLQYCTAIPVDDFLPLIKDALIQSVIKMNSKTTSGYLLAPTNNQLLYATPVGRNGIFVDLRFSARETFCSKNSAVEIENCELNGDPLAESVICLSSVFYSFGTVADIFLRCKDTREQFDDDSSAFYSSESSFESSEEIVYKGRRPQFQDEYYISVDWNNLQSNQRRRNPRKNNPRKHKPWRNPIRGLSAKKNPRRKQKKDSVME
ncbi:secreted phosphoprotein 24-like [Narcine bancroftii]|uniref:secreted phosphoprotein 24-like n=1 Tax=Narcine bancroftii TaxID=1343680 RepID=UPI00383223EA